MKCKYLLEACAAEASEVAAVQLASCWEHCGHRLEPVVHLQNKCQGSQYRFGGLDSSTRTPLQAGQMLANVLCQCPCA